MNTVHTKKVVPRKQTYTVSDLIGSNMGSHTAFVGSVGIGPAHALYLITYDSVVLADNPRTTWSGEAVVVVDRFCDVTINEV